MYRLERRRSSRPNDRLEVDADQFDDAFGVDLLRRLYVFTFLIDLCVQMLVSIADRAALMLAAPTTGACCAFSVFALSVPFAPRRLRRGRPKSTRDG